MDYIDRWKASHGNKPDIKMYGSSMTYEMAAAFLNDCEVVEDWGCGRGAFTLFRKKPIIGVDGTQTPYVHKVADLQHYTSDVEGILLRHVLEHNDNWKDVLTNAINSAKKKLCIVLFIPLSENGTEEISRAEDTNIPGLSIDKTEFLECFSHLKYVHAGRLYTDANYRNEHVFYITK